MLLLWWLPRVQVISLSSWWKKFFHLVGVINYIICFHSGRISPQFWEVFHKPTTSLFVSLLVFQQLHYNLLGRVLSKLICGRSCFFLLHSVIPMIYLLFFLPEALWCCSRWPIISFCQDHVFFLLIHLTGVLCSHSSSFTFSSFASLANLSAVWNPSYPLGHSFNSFGGSVLLISSSILSSFQVHVQFLPFTVGVLSKL